MSGKGELENLSFNSTSNYTVINEIARGGMGIIYLAKKNTGGVIDDVVLKSVRTVKSEEEEKLRKEASIATMLRHENIVKTYGLEIVPVSKLPEEIQNEVYSEHDSDSKQGNFFSMMSKKQEERHMLLLIMDYIKGTDYYTLLLNHLKNGLLFPMYLSAFIISRIASSLAYAHTYIVHRDISPENILISEQGVCKLTDFGVAVVAHQKPKYWAGKLMYMSPEQIRNDPIDERSDIYALGLIAYQAVTGINLLYASPKLNFEEQVNLIYSQMESPLIPPHRVRKDVPVELSRIICKMLANSPEYRYQRASHVLSDLEKNYLYAKGFGPTNNGLAAYIDIFNSGFQKYNEDQLQQLSFLNKSVGQEGLKRPLTIEGYTKVGQKLLAQRKGSLIFRKLKELHKKKKQTEPSRITFKKKPVIKVKYLGNVVETFSLEKKDVTVGRSSKNDIILAEKTVSSHHAKFFMREGVPIIEDLGSHNGTFVNGSQTQRHKIHEGDKIQIGTHTLYFLWEARTSETSYIISLSGDVNSINLKTNDISIQFLPEEDNLAKISTIIEEVINSSSLGVRKQNVIPPAIYEAIRLFSGEVETKPMKLRILRGKKYLTFRCTAPEQSYGYEAFLAAIYRRREVGVEERFRFEPEELALSLILKVFDRIEIFRFSREILLTSHIV